MENGAKFFADRIYYINKKLRNKVFEGNIYKSENIKFIDLVTSIQDVTLMVTSNIEHKENASTKEIWYKF